MVPVRQEAMGVQERPLAFPVVACPTQAAAAALPSREERKAPAAQAAAAMHKQQPQAQMAQPIRVAAAGEHEARIVLQLLTVVPAVQVS
jgi:hypothetical protein